MPSTSRSSAPGIAAAVARPPETCTILSARPCTTSVGTRRRAAAGERFSWVRTAIICRSTPLAQAAVEVSPASSRVRVLGVAGSPVSRSSARSRRCPRRTPRGRGLRGRSSAGISRGYCQPTERLPVVDMMLVSDRTRRGLLDGHRLRDHPAHRHPDDVGRRRGRGGRGARTRRRPCPRSSTGPAPCVRRRPGPASGGSPARPPCGAAGVAVVVADDVEAARGEHRAQVGVPEGHRVARPITSSSGSSSGSPKVW